ncbi:MAG: pseudouridine synthase [Clostridia bacterium]|nr:pseudouridine synthase [Clostridia bacterium]
MTDEKSGVRLNKYLSDCGYCSRREADRLIESGAVTIDGIPGHLGDRVRPGMEVRVNGSLLKDGAKKVYLALYKPRGIVSTADEREPLNVVSYLHYPTRVYPVGRLDKESEGLLLMTSDGEIVNRLLCAAGGHEKEYLVVVNKPLTEEFLKAMRAGVFLEELKMRTLPARVFPETQNSFRVVLTQGLNRQIRRMCETLGYRVRSLKRLRIENITLDGLSPGHFRELTEEEKQELFKRIGMS